MVREISASRIILRAIDKIIALLNELKIDYAIIGGMALQVWGRERASKDVDIVINVEGDKREELVNYLRRIPFSIRYPLKRIGKAMLIFSTYGDEETGLPIDLDLFVAETDFETTVLKRALDIDVLGQRLKVVTAEDLLLYKLMASRPIDLVDAESIVEENKEIDRDYLARWAKKLGVANELKKLMKKNA